MTVEVPGEETAGDGSDHRSGVMSVCSPLLTVDFIVFPEDHLHMIPL